MTFYVEIQDLDYDDYPQGNPTRIGWFHTEDEAEKYLENTKRFRQVQIVPGFFLWQDTGRYGRHTVQVKNIMDTRMVRPESFA